MNNKKLFFIWKSLTWSRYVPWCWWGSRKKVPTWTLLYFYMKKVYFLHKKNVAIFFYIKKVPKGKNSLIFVCSERLPGRGTVPGCWSVSGHCSPWCSECSGTAGHSPRTACPSVGSSRPLCCQPASATNVLPNENRFFSQ